MTFHSKICSGGELIVAKKHDQINNQHGNILRSLREEQGLTRELVAERADIGLRHLAAIELGEKNPSVNTLYRLLRAIGASADRVFYPEHSKKDDTLERIECLAATCSEKQRKLLIRLIEAVVSEEQ